MMCDNRVAGGRDGVPPPSETMMTKCAAGGGTPALPDAAGGGTPALPVRKRIDHRGPLSIDVSRAWYFITLCAEGHRPWVGSRVPRDRDDAADFDSIANAILSAARWYHEHGKWRLALFLVMPDHVHFIVHLPGVGRDGVPPPSETMTTKCAAGGGTPALPDVIRHWKHYLSECYGILFQRDFWDTRIRDDRQYDEEFRYICNNPVRRGLCQTAREWRYVIAFDHATGVERMHRGGHAGRVILPGKYDCTGQEAEYMRKKERTGAYYQRLIIDYLEKFPGSQRKKINEFMLDEIRGDFTSEEKIAKITHLLTVMRRNHVIENRGTDKNPRWFYIDEPKDGVASQCKSQCKPQIESEVAT